MPLFAGSDCSQAEALHRPGGPGYPRPKSQSFEDAVMEFELLQEIQSLIAGPPEPEPGPKTLLHHLQEAVFFPLSRIIDGLTDEEFAWSPVADAKPANWVPTGHDPKSDPFTSIAWRWNHFTAELHGIAQADICLGSCDSWIRHLPEIRDEASAVASLRSAIRAAAKAIAAASDERLDELVENEFGRHPRRHWVSLFLVEAVHHAAEIGVIRDLYRLRAVRT